MKYALVYSTKLNSQIPMGSRNLPANWAEGDYGILCGLFFNTKEAANKAALILRGREMYRPLFGQNFFVMKVNVES